MIGDSVLTEPGNHEIIVTDSFGCIQHWVVLLIVGANYEIDIDSNYVPPIIINGIPHDDDFTISFVVASSLGCDSTINFNYHPLVSTSEGLVKQNIQVYPNPNNGHFFIENKMPSEPLEVEIWDGVGRQVFTERTKAVERSEFDLSYLPSGVYWLKIRQLDAVLTKRLVLIK